MWVNLFQDTLAALALATDPPTRRILNRNPEPKSNSLITAQMWKMIIGQSIYQMLVTLVLYFAGAAIFSYSTEHEMQQLQTAVFNTYVWMQIFNMYKYVPSSYLRALSANPPQQPANRALVQLTRGRPPQLALHRNYLNHDGGTDTHCLCWRSCLFCRPDDWCPMGILYGPRVPLYSLWVSSTSHPRLRH